MRQKITDIPVLQEDLADIVSSSAELSNTQAAKVISYRAEQHAALELADFLVFFNDSWAFVVKCEVLSRRMIVGLRGTVVGQVSVSLLTKTNDDLTLFVYQYYLGQALFAVIPPNSNIKICKTCRG